MSDIYDEAIAYLTSDPDRFQDRVGLAWNWSNLERPGSVLFRYCSGNGQPMHHDILCGCLTQVKNGLNAATEELTNLIRADPRIPDDVDNITPESLPVFAEYQRMMDNMFPGRTPKYS